MSLLGRLRSRSLRAQLQLMMLSLLALSIGSLFVLHLFSERAMLARIRDYTEELSTAIEITQEQPGSGADPQKAVLAYAEKLRKLGVRDVSIADAGAEVVQASTDPRIVGKKLARKRGPTEYVIRGVLGEEAHARPPHHLEPDRPDRGRRPARRLRGDHPHPRRLLGPVPDGAREPDRGDARRVRARHAAVAGAGLGRLAAGPGPHRRRAPRGRGRPLARRSARRAATSSERSPAPSTRWWSGSARAGRSRSGSASRSARPRWAASPRHSPTRSATRSTRSASRSTTCAPGSPPRARRSAPSSRR